MADLSDVSNAVVALLASVVYPNGIGQPSAVLKNGDPVAVKIFPGWPLPATLDADLAAGSVNISVFPRPEGGSLPILGPETTETTAPVHTLTLAVSGETVTVGGTVSTPQNACVFANKKPYVYPLQAGDSLTSVATALAALIAVDIPGTTNTGPVITVPTYQLFARVGGFGTATVFIAREWKSFQITVWASTPEVRDAAAKLIDPALRILRRINLADGSYSQISFKSDQQLDTSQKQSSYQRMLIYALDWAVSLDQQVPEIIVEEVNLSVPNAPEITAYL